MKMQSNYHGRFKSHGLAENQVNNSKYNFKKQDSLNVDLVSSSGKKIQGHKKNDENLAEEIEGEGVKIDLTNKEKLEKMKNLQAQIALLQQDIQQSDQELGYDFESDVNTLEY